ncbi:hypothetical protein C4588_08380, partial [Candidatus Parcubacteria bacterium]
MLREENTIKYNWTRFWSPRGDGYLSDTDGYLLDPEEKYSHLYQKHVVSLDDISHIPCLILLGEPGAGKSCTIAEEETLIRNKNLQTLFLELSSCENNADLNNALFEDEIFLSSLKNNVPIHIFLDDLDEYLLKESTVCKYLIRKFNKIQTANIYLRIACRTADWPLTFEDDLKKIWGKDNVDVYELLPLRQKDVIEAAKVNELNWNKFLEIINEKEVVPLAIKPLTLNFLINQFRSNDNELPSTKNELYEKGCLGLCEDSRERIERKLTGKYSCEERMMTAGRIAAATIFSNKYAIWTGSNLEVIGKDIKILELCGGAEVVRGEEISIREDIIRETLNSTGLFSSRGPDRLKWAHQTYAEFLAAWYLVASNLTSKQIKDFLVHHGDPQKKLALQLHETAAWLATMRADIFVEVMSVEPDVLLKSDIANSTEKDRRLLVKKLLEMYEEEKLLYRYEGNHHYKKLYYSSLADDLKPYIYNRKKGKNVRLFALEITKQCKLKDIHDVLVDIALNNNEEYIIREDAVCIISKAGDKEIKAKLKPLVTAEAGEDPHGQLKGYAVTALWPEHITAENLFSNLTKPKSNLVGGSYDNFLHSELIDKMNLEDLPVALKWAKNQEMFVENIFEELTDNIILKALDNLHIAGVIEALIEAVFFRINNFGQILSSRKNTEFSSKLSIEKRKLLIKSLLPIISPEYASDIAYGGIITSEDFFWLTEFFNTE